MKDTEHNPPWRRARYALALLALGSAWGLSVPLTKIAVSTGHHPLGLIVWQLVVVTACLAVVTMARGLRLRLERRVLLLYLVVGLVGTIVPNSFSFVAAAQLPAGVMGIVIALVPMFSLAIALVIRAEPPSLVRGTGVLLGALAVVLIAAPDTSLPDPAKAVFVLVALVAPFCYAAEGHCIVRLAPASVDPVTMLLGASALGIVIAVPLALATGAWFDPFAAWGRPETALLLSSLAHAVAYTGYIWLVGAAGAVFASQIAYVVTIAAVFLSALLLGESYSGWVWAALALMLVGLALVRPRRPDARAARDAVVAAPSR